MKTTDNNPESFAAFALSNQEKIINSDYLGLNNNPSDDDENDDSADHVRIVGNEFDPDEFIGIHPNHRSQVKEIYARRGYFKGASSRCELIGCEE